MSDKHKPAMTDLEAAAIDMDDMHNCRSCSSFPCPDHAPIATRTEAYLERYRENKKVARDVWRQGHKLGRTLYINDVCVGMVDTPEIAKAIVDRMNASV